MDTRNVECAVELDGKKVLRRLRQQKQEEEKND